MSKITVNKAHPSFVAGWEGEHNVTQVYIDIGEFQKEFGPGTVHLMVRRRGDQNAYLAPVQITGSQVRWTMTAADMSRPGYGELQLMYLVEDQAVKSEMYHFYVKKALSGSSGEEPDPCLPYLEKVAEYADSAIRAAEIAEAAAAGVHDVTGEVAQAKKYAADAKSAAAIAQQTAEGIRDISSQVQQVETSTQAAESARVRAEAAAKRSEDAAAAGGAKIDDGKASSDTTYSSQKIHQISLRKADISYVDAKLNGISALVGGGL